ncbi:alpha/beta hydrolase, partial [Daejeonella sp.]|jgi:acetyl esterase/lipase|uniref:alpha/beta hydrolase n=1 Tax=Daejeonella sp. TaxID=2805397 RepID=UPI0037C0BAA1
MHRVIYFIVFLGIISLSDSLKGQEIISLYDGIIPNSKPSIDREVSARNKDGLMITRYVSNPTLIWYKPAKVSDIHSAVIICPGGGYGALASSSEGSDVAQALSKLGISAFVLKYRLPDDLIMVDKSIGPLQDAQRSIQLLRENAKEWNIDPSKIGIMGFSAGGHLAASLSTNFSQSLISNPLKTSFRPDFSVLIYPVISFTDSLANKGSRDNLIGNNPSEETKRKFSNELQVSAQTPHAFLVHASNDSPVPVANSIVYYQSLLKLKIYSSLILYPGGNHGFGMNNKTTSSRWMDDLKFWLIDNKYL